MIWAAYLAIPIILIYFARRRREVPFRELFWLFGAFILSCGFTHLMDVVTFYHPVYRLSGVVKLLTAIASCATVMALVPVIPRALAMRYPEELERLVEERTALAVKRAEELARAQEYLQEKTKILESVLQNIGEGVVVVDGHQRFTHVNPAARRVLPTLELPPDQVADWPEHFGLADENGRLLPADRLPLARAAQHQEVVEGAELRLIGGESDRWIQVTATPLSLESGGAVAVFRETTSQRNQVAELIRARDEAVRADRVKSEFLAVMSHELRTPLNGVRGMLELLQDTALDERQEEFASVALSCSGALLQLIDDLLDLSKIESGKLDLHETSFSPAQVVSNVENVFRPGLTDSRLKLRGQVQPGTPEWLLGDEARILQILVNLVGNAIKYSDEGLVSFSVGPKSSGQGLKLVIQDEGPGIPDSFLPELFEPFTQVDSTSKRRHGGVGLGLAIVKRLVDLMGGELKLESQEGQGTCFEIELPLTAVAPQEKAPCDSMPDLSRLKIMVVEDNPINRRVVTLQLAKLGATQALVAEDGSKALELARAQRVDLILLDCQMPGIDGFEVAERLRSDPEAFGEPIVIALTAHALKKERERCLKVGMNDFLSKPLAFEDLRSTLAHWARTLNSEAGPGVDPT